MAREQFDLIVFDWDGTLMDSTVHITRSIQAACRDLGLPVPADEAASYVIGLGLRDALQIAAPTLDPSEYPRLAERYRFHFLVKGIWLRRGTIFGVCGHNNTFQIAGKG